MENQERVLARNTGTSMTEEDYQKLTNMCDTHHMTDEEAKLFINRELGFEVNKIVIVHTVDDYYLDGCYLKKWHTYERNPQYNATDWNYFRFDVCGWQYEYENGTLRLYYS